MPRLSRNSYGESSVRLVKVVRHGDRHDVRDLTVDIAIEGDFARVHISGDNSTVLPTATLRDTVYAKAREAPIGEPESFALMLARHFLGVSPAATLARVRVGERAWRHLRVGDREQGGSFERAGRERRMAECAATRDGALELFGGFDDAALLKSAGASFEGFARDQYTTLGETADLMLAGSLSARWRYGSEDTAFAVIAKAVRNTLIETFAEHRSRSVQHTLYAMAKAALDYCAEIDEVSLRMPETPHRLVDLSSLGLDNPSEVFVATREPHGLVQATVRR